MLEGIRRQLSHRREEAEKAKLRKIEVERRLSRLKMKRLEERKAAEVGLREQRISEITSLTEAKQALVERKQAEKELRRMTPGLGRRMARVAKGALYDVPVKTARALSRPGVGEKLRKVVIGDPSIVFGRRKPTEYREPKQSAQEFIFGKPSKDEEKDTLKDILS